MRLAVAAEDERNGELELAGLSDPKKNNNKGNSIKAADLMKTLKNDTQPANASKTAANTTKIANGTNGTSAANSTAGAKAKTGAGFAPGAAPVSPA